MDKSIISVLEKEFGDEWVKYKRGTYIEHRAIILSIFIELISQKNIIKPLFPTYKDFINQYKDVKLLHDAIEKGENDSVILYKININDQNEKISNDFCLNVLLSDKLKLDIPDIGFISNISKKFIKLAKEDKEKIFEYLIEQDEDNHDESDEDNHDESDEDENVNKSENEQIQIPIHMVNNPIVNKMWKIANYVGVCKKFINLDKNYGLIFKIATKLTDGFMSEFNTGGCPTIPTQIREYIVKDILGHESKPRKNGYKKSKNRYDSIDTSFVNHKKRKRKKNTDSNENKKKMCWMYSDGLVTDMKQNIIIPSHNNDLAPGLNYNFVVEESIDEKSNMSIDFTNLKTKENIVLIDDDITINEQDNSLKSIVELINNLSKIPSNKEEMDANFANLFN